MMQGKPIKGRKAKERKAGRKKNAKEGRIRRKEGMIKGRQR
jgi:hypothetical protein